SIMNYQWQFPAPWMNEDKNGNGALNPGEDINGNGVLDNIWKLGYSSAALRMLNESSLDETQGIGGTPGQWVQIGLNRVALETGPVDWNNDGDKGTETQAAADINYGDINQAGAIDGR